MKNQLTVNGNQSELLFGKIRTQCGLCALPINCLGTGMPRSGVTRPDKKTQAHNNANTTHALKSALLNTPQLIEEMADKPTSSAAAAGAAEGLANLHLDEVTGERVSKTELKKRKKQREVEEKKKAAQAAAPPKPVAAAKTKEDEVELDPSVNPPYVCVH
jgi:hypothetical protein